MCCDRMAGCEATGEVDSRLRGNDDEVRGNDDEVGGNGDEVGGE